MLKNSVNDPVFIFLPTNMIFDIVGKHFRALLHSSAVAHDVLNNGINLDTLAVFKTSIGVLHILLWVSLPVALIYMFKRKRGFGVFEGAKKLGMCVLLCLASLAFLDLLLLMFTGTFSLAHTIHFIITAFSMVAFLENLGKPGANPFQFAEPEVQLGGIFGGMSEAFMVIQYVISICFVIYSFIVHAVSSKASVTGRKIKNAAFLLNWSMIFLVSLYSWHLVLACITGSICMPMQDPSIDYDLALKINDTSTNITVQQCLTVIKACTKDTNLHSALIEAARLKNESLRIGTITVKPSDALSPNESIIHCKEFGNAGEAAINEVCTGLLQTFDTMHSGVAMLFISSFVLFVMILVSFWYGDAGKKAADVNMTA